MKLKLVNFQKIKAIATSSFRVLTFSAEVLSASFVVTELLILSSDMPQTLERISVLTDS